MKMHCYVPLFFMLIFAFSTNAFAQNESQTGAVLGMWDIHLKDDANHEAFEAFYLNEVIPLEERCMPGLEVLLVKGDRGVDKGTYKYIWKFKSVSDRNAYYPVEGGSEDIKGLGAAASELCKDDYESLNEKYMGFYDPEKYQALTSPPYTDLVVLKSKN